MAEIVTRNRKLVNEDDLFTQNAWDDAEWTSEMLDRAEKRIEQQKFESTNHIGPKVEQIEREVGEKWNDFYRVHGDKFFKDRQWIFSEFPEILAKLSCDSPPFNLLEVGCGVGNAVAHVIKHNQNPRLHIYCCDISSNAIETLKKRQFYADNQEKVTAFQADISDSDSLDILSKKIGLEAVDTITMIFTLSALKPDVMRSTLSRLSSLLKPGGMFLFRDYAKNDLTQLRFKGRAYLDNNYYVRSDGTTSYFFTKDYVGSLFSSVGLTQLQLKDDNRILVNRSKALKMCRCWIQAKFMKPI